MADNIQVAVRVRPFTQREKKANARNVVEIDGDSTILNHPEAKYSRSRAESSKFHFSRSFQSFSREDDRFADQEAVFKELALPMLDNAWKGFNATLFAYGQTGSGKSYSVMGSQAEPGVVPRFCRQLFDDVDAKQVPNIEIKVRFSMIELYNEKFHDLLPAKKGNASKLPDLTLREHKEKGFYVQGVVKKAVGSYSEVMGWIDQGNKHKTIAATKMNEHSSRSHTIVTIELEQENKKLKKRMESKINLVDLAGSERVEQTGAEGQRFKEATKINQSLSTLIQVIEALTGKAKGKRDHVPFRNSQLTKLLQQSLGGNSRTVMLATISPAEENYSQTLSTLQYADRAKSIKTAAKVNNESTDVKVQQLQQELKEKIEEVEYLKKRRGRGVGTDGEDPDDVITKLGEEIKRLKEELLSGESKWKQELVETRQQLEALQAKEIEEQREREKHLHLWNLEEDPTLNRRKFHIIEKNVTTVGSPRSETPKDIIIYGPNITPDHAELKKTGVITKDIAIVPVSGRVLVNGVELRAERKLDHQDRILFGYSKLFVFHHPKKKEHLKTITWEQAQDEIIHKGKLDASKGGILLLDDVQRMLPDVEEANSMAKILKKPVKFETVIFGGFMQGDIDGPSQVKVKVTNTLANVNFFWSKSTFEERFYLMSKLFEQFDHTGKPFEAEKKEDPFWEPEDSEVLIGVVYFPLRNLGQNMELQEDNWPVKDYTNETVGALTVKVSPVGENVKPVREFVDLVGKTSGATVEILSGNVKQKRFAKVWCRFRFYDDVPKRKKDVDEKKEEVDNWKTSDKQSTDTAQFHFKKSFWTYDPTKVDVERMAFYRDNSLYIELWGQQQTSSSSERASFTATDSDLHDRVCELTSIVEELSRITRRTEGDDDSGTPTDLRENLLKVLAKAKF